jgi:hypothetical protein
VIKTLSKDKWELQSCELFTLNAVSIW